ncbi:unnamed protein product, partial [Amoebophrya sp. A120]
AQEQAPRGSEEGIQTGTDDRQAQEVEEAQAAQQEEQQGEVPRTGTQSDVGGSTDHSSSTGNIGLGTSAAASAGNTGNSDPDHATSNPSHHGGVGRQPQAASGTGDVERERTPEPNGDGIETRGSSTSGGASDLNSPGRSSGTEPTGENQQPQHFTTSTGTGTADTDGTNKTTFAQGHGTPTSGSTASGGGSASSTCFSTEAGTNDGTNHDLRRADALPAGETLPMRSAAGSGSLDTGESHAPPVAVEDAASGCPPGGREDAEGLRTSADPSCSLRPRSLSPPRSVRRGGSSDAGSSGRSARGGGRRGRSSSVGSTSSKSSDSDSDSESDSDSTERRQTGPGGGSPPPTPRPDGSSSSTAVWRPRGKAAAAEPLVPEVAPEPVSEADLAALKTRQEEGQSCESLFLKVLAEFLAERQMGDKKPKDFWNPEIDDGRDYLQEARDQFAADGGDLGQTTALDPDIWTVATIMTMMPHCYGNFHAFDLRACGTWPSLEIVVYETYRLQTTQCLPTEDERFFKDVLNFFHERISSTTNSASTSLVVWEHPLILVPERLAP